MDHDEYYEDPDGWYDASEPYDPAEEKAAEIALDLADEARWAAEEAANPQPGHTEMCEGCHGTGGGYEDEAWDDEAQDYVPIDYEDCPECGGCGYYDCDATCDNAG
ncbi:hypothetical protein [Streptomyces sp. NRRL B-24484]|uniref:hypothetical protein n=1 Tax=Streptomyces sp. NRRL B-24484 TaxID=1463833 RepID=UPI0004BF6BF8|nr:hypothetical protein [Streptomyces sp. NRRL B-24484]